MQHTNLLIIILSSFIVYVLVSVSLVGGAAGQVISCVDVLPPAASALTITGKSAVL